MFVRWNLGISKLQETEKKNSKLHIETSSYPGYLKYTLIHLGTKKKFYIQKLRDTGIPDIEIPL